MSGHQVTIRWHADFFPLQRGQKVYKTLFMVGEATTVIVFDGVITWNLKGFPPWNGDFISSFSHADSVHTSLGLNSRGFPVIFSK